MASTAEGSALYAYHLLQSVYDLHQVALVRHHLVDVLVGARDLVQDPFVLSAYDISCLFDQIRNRILLLGLGAAHPPAGPMRAGVEALRRSFAAHDVAAHAHA